MGTSAAEGRRRCVGDLDVIPLPPAPHRFRVAREQLEEFLLGGFDGGPSAPWTEAHVDEIVVVGRGRLKRRSGLPG